MKGWYNVKKLLTLLAITGMFALGCGPSTPTTPPKGRPAPKMDGGAPKMETPKTEGEKKDHAAPKMDDKDKKEKDEKKKDKL